MDHAGEGWPFSPKLLKRPSFVQRLLRRHPVENAVVAINNLLAERGGISELGPQQVTAVLESFHVEPQRVRSELEAMLSMLLLFVLENVDEAQVGSEFQRLAS